MDLTSDFLLQASILLNKYPPICTQLRNKCINEYMGGVGTDSKVTCKWCYSAWKDGNFVLKIEPQKKKKLLKKFSPPTKSYNFLVFKCLICGRKSKIPLAKKPKTKDCKKTKTHQVLLLKEETKKVKKKKKKDKFCGLNPALFRNASPTQDNNSKTKHLSAVEDENLKYLSVNQQINNSISCKKIKKKKRSKKKKKQPSSIHNFINDC